MRFLSLLTFCVLNGAVCSRPSLPGYGCEGHPKGTNVSIDWLIWGWPSAHQEHTLSLTGEKPAGAYPQPWETTMPKELSVASSLPSAPRRASGVAHLSRRMLSHLAQEAASCELGAHHHGG